MKITLLFALLLVAATSNAEVKLETKFSVEGRVDYLNSNVETKLQNGTTSSVVGQTDFKVDRVRPNLVGKLLETPLSYRIRLNLSKSAATTNRDNLTDFVDYAYIDDKLSDSFTLRVGKALDLVHVGWETTYSSADVYSLSQVFNTNVNTYNIYKTGAYGLYTMGDHKFTLSVTTPTKSLTDTTGNSQQNHGIAYGLSYWGTFLDGMIQPIAGFTMMRTDGNVDHATPASQTTTVTNTLWAVGARVKPIPGLEIDLSYDSLTQPWNFATSTGDPDVTTSMVARAQYTIDALIPFVNFISDNYKTNTTSNNFTKTVFDVGVWYVPYKEAKFRYHLAYTDDTKTFDAANTNSKVKTNKIFLGMRFDI